MTKYFVFNQSKQLFLIEKQMNLPQDAFFYPSSDLKTTTNNQTNLFSITGEKVFLRSTRPVFIVKTDLADLFEDLQANCEFSCIFNTENPQETQTILRDYLAQID